ncbi:hypothetical protein CCC_00870 [Paramagnetospirillum magnetotacticum MS-1]|uniref:Glycosyltransferase RgtA/B/C/D-like domain-containing protein n=1 Tax=Paramagnetospirillum magnetotacticum MS-1 TaxID=272627 RepID=A0A0C2YDL7_PARME|nr:hypothetical protein CCC_00870 [Paramagnetospirillum magnetotacticum MS-1]
MAAAFAAAAAAVLLGLRVESAISLARPLLVVTSGAEEEAILGVLRAMDGQAYVDTARIPFAATYYNWAFYDLYAAFIRMVLAMFGLGIDWATTAGRFLSLLATFACGLVASAAITRVAPGCSVPVRLHNAALTAWLSIGPLVGYWAISINVELWAHLCTMAAMLVMMIAYERNRLGAVAAASLLSLAAWSFKQSYIFAPMAMGLFLLIRRDWRGIALAVVLHLAGLAATLGFGSPEYRAMMLAWRGSDFALWQLSRNLLNVGVKILPVAVAAALAAPLMLNRRALAADTPLLLGLCGLIATAPIIPAAAKVGAAENYFFPLVFFLALLGARGVAELDRRHWPRLPSLVLAAAWGAEMVACALVIGGVTGSNGVSHLDRRYGEQRPCVAQLPSPMYAFDPYLALPWMHADGPYFVLAYQYAMERAAGRSFERGGIGGLVGEGYFASVVLPTGMPAEIDGTPLAERYRLDRRGCAGLDIYLRAGN